MIRKMLFLSLTVVVALLGSVAFAMANRAGYESAEYKVIESDGAMEIREYPDLLLVSTTSRMDSQGRDGSFMRLFQYISGANAGEQKIAMTTPVFMEGEFSESDVAMGFVMPKEVAAQGAPAPTGDRVSMRQRKGGRFAVIRFSGRLDSELAKQQEQKLREWMEQKDLDGHASVEAAGYDPPFTPSRLRRNEVLIRLKNQPEEAATNSSNSNQP
ncbi:MAG: heme-binding protein [Pirellulaceae bacterium]